MWPVNRGDRIPGIVAIVLEMPSMIELYWGAKSRGLTMNPEN
jgi:hypothetical protein